MTKDKMNIPQIRFKGFEGEWEARKVQRISEFTVGGGTPSTSIKEYWEGELPWIQSSDLKEDILYASPTKFITLEAIQNSATKLIPAGSIAIVTRVGVGKLALIPHQFATSQDFLSLVNLKINQLFALYSLFLLLQKKKHMTQGTSIKGITKAELLNKKIYVPMNISEQTKIGELFQKIDQVIELQQKALDTARAYKQSMLQKMFPQKGEKVPRVRFAGFSGEWESKKLELIIKTYSFRKYLAEPEDKGLYPVIQQGDKPIIGYSNNEPFMSYKEVILFGDHTLSLYRPTSPFLLSTDGLKILNLQGLEPTYAFYLISRYMPLSEGYKRHFSILKEQMIFYPKSIEEQTAIGNFFQKLDQQIEQQAQKLATYQQLKKAMLQRMFV